MLNAMRDNVSLQLPYSTNSSLRRQLVRCCGVQFNSGAISAALTIDYVNGPVVLDKFQEFYYNHIHYSTI